MFKTILVPTDGSQLSRSAEDAAILFARVNGATLVALAVAQPDNSSTGGTGTGQPRDSSGDVLASAQERAESVARRAHEADIPSQCSVAFSNDAYQEILKAAADFQCDVIFMAAYGEHGIRRALLGSQTQNVLINANLPVVVFR